MEQRASAMTKRKRSKPHKAPPALPLVGPPPEAVTRRTKARTSVKEPLLDWTEEEDGADRWLLERVANDVQRD